MASFLPPPDLFDVRPALSIDHTPRLCIGDIKSISNVLVGNSTSSVHRSHSPNVILGQLGRVVLLTVLCFWAKAIAATLFSHVTVVVSNGAKKQMRRITARRIVATMQHGQVFRNAAKGESVSHAMGSVKFPPKTTNKVLCGDSPVTPLVNGSLPMPARVTRGFGNSGPESQRKPRIARIGLHRSYPFGVTVGVVSSNARPFAWSNYSGLKPMYLMKEVA